MPASATRIASQVRGAICWRRKIQARNAVSKGETLITISVLATVVMVSAIMKQQNITHHISPETRPGLPSRRSTASAWPRCCQASAAATNRAANTLRQKVTSKPCAFSRWRVSTPAMLHKVAAHTISRTARECGVKSGMQVTVPAWILPI